MVANPHTTYIPAKASSMDPPKKYQQLILTLKNYKCLILNESRYTMYSFSSNAYDHCIRKM